MSTRVTGIVMGLLGVGLVALAGVFLISRQATGTTLNRDSVQIATQAKEISSQARQISTLQTQVTDTQQLVKTAAQASKGAAAAHLGICVAASENSTDSYGDSYTALQSYDITSPSMSAGVASCPSGSFISVVPSKN